jgi:hypothetical protein
MRVVAKAAFSRVGRTWFTDRGISQPVWASAPKIVRFYVVPLRYKYRRDFFTARVD